MVSAVCNGPSCPKFPSFKEIVASVGDEAMAQLSSPFENASPGFQTAFEKAFALADGSDLEKSFVAFAKVAKQNKAFATEAKQVLIAMAKAAGSPNPEAYADRILSNPRTFAKEIMKDMKTMSSQQIQEVAGQIKARATGEKLAAKSTPAETTPAVLAA